ncbi:MAG: alpha/beta hydrolase [Planctomycetota bacterium]|nr:alpha/beta hydrolase [Planctomycetota bacterium]
MPATARSPLRTMLNLSLLIASLYGAVCLFAFLGQRRMVYFPGGPPQGDPADVGLAFEEQFIETTDGVRLHGWWIPAQPMIGALILSHGNGGNIAGRLHIARALHEMGLGVFLFDYRGYGSSEGTPDEEGTYLDAEAVWERVTGPLGIAPERVLLQGESLGGAVAVELARRRRAAGLILECSFTSLPEIGATAYPWLPVRALSRIRYESIDKIGALDLPILILHSPQDEIVPFAHAERMLAAAGAEAQLHPTSGGHNDGGFTRRAEDLEAVQAFCRACLGSAEQ